MSLPPVTETPDDDPGARAPGIADRSIYFPKTPACCSAPIRAEANWWLSIDSPMSATLMGWKFPPLSSVARAGQFTYNERGNTVLSIRSSLQRSFAVKRRSLSNRSSVNAARSRIVAASFVALAAVTAASSARPFASSLRARASAIFLSASCCVTSASSYPTHAETNAAVTPIPPNMAAQIVAHLKTASQNGIDNPHTALPLCWIRTSSNVGVRLKGRGPGAAPGPRLAPLAARPAGVRQPRGPKSRQRASLGFAR